MYNSDTTHLSLDFNTHKLHAMDNDFHLKKKFMSPQDIP